MSDDLIFSETAESLEKYFLKSNFTSPRKKIKEMRIEDNTVQARNLLEIHPYRQEKSSWNSSLKAIYSGFEIQKNVIEKKAVGRSNIKAFPLSNSVF